MQSSSVFFLNDPATTEIYTLPLHDALPISRLCTFARRIRTGCGTRLLVFRSPLRRGLIRKIAAALTWTDSDVLLVYAPGSSPERSEEHTSELQSRLHLVCRLLLEKKKLHPVPGRVGVADQGLVIAPGERAVQRASYPRVGLRADHYKPPCPAPGQHGLQHGVLARV